MMNQVAKREAGGAIAARMLVFLLLLAVAGLSAVARHSQFLPTSHPIHYLGSATKMNVLHLPVDWVPPRTAAMDRVIPRQPQSRAIWVLDFETFDIPQIALRVSRQHRSPPISV